MGLGRGESDSISLTSADGCLLFFLGAGVFGLKASGGGGPGSIAESLMGPTAFVLALGAGQVDTDVVCLVVGLVARGGGDRV